MPEIKIDEFGFVLMAGLILIFILMIFWTTPKEPLPLIEPSSVTIRISPGRIETFYLYIKGRATNVTLRGTGRIATWISFDKNYFNVIDETKVKVSISVPDYVEPGIYIGNIEFSSLGGKLLIPLEIQVKEIVFMERISTKSILLGDFSIEKVSAFEKVGIKENFEVFRSLFSRQDANLIISIPEEKFEKVVKAEIRILVEETNQAGNLIVLFNEKEVFNKKVGVGEIKIGIGKEEIRRTNSISILAGPPGLKFWATNVYKIKVVEFWVEYEGIYKKEFSFRLEPHQAKNFLYLQISFLKVNREISPDLIIKINGQIIYYKRPPLIYFNETFYRDIFGNPILVKEENKVSFELKREGKLDVEGAILIIYYAS